MSVTCKLQNARLKAENREEQSAGGQDNFPRRTLTRPSYDKEAKSRGSFALQATPATEGNTIERHRMHLASKEEV